MVWYCRKLWSSRPGGALPGGGGGGGGGSLKDHFLSPGSLAKGVFLAKTPKNWHFGAKLGFVFGKLLLKREYLGWNSLKSCKNGLMIRKFSLAKGMFSTKISLAKGIRSKTGAAHPRQFFFGVLSPGVYGPLDIQNPFWQQSTGMSTHFACF